VKINNVLPTCHYQTVNGLNKYYDKYFIYMLAFGTYMYIYVISYLMGLKVNDEQKHENFCGFHYLYEFKYILYIISSSMCQLYYDNLLIVYLGIILVYFCFDTMFDLSIYIFKARKTFHSFHCI